MKVILSWTNTHRNPKKTQRIVAQIVLIWVKLGKYLGWEFNETALKRLRKNTATYEHDLPGPIKHPSVPELIPLASLAWDQLESRSSSRGRRFTLLPSVYSGNCLKCFTQGQLHRPLGGNTLMQRWCDCQENQPAACYTPPLMHSVSLHRGAD